MLYRQVIGGLTAVVLSFSPASAQQIELPPKEKCLISEENLVSHTTIIPDIYNAQGKTVMRYMDKRGDDESKPRCGMSYEIDLIKPYGTGIIIIYKKGVRINGE